MDVRFRDRRADLFSSLSYFSAKLKVTPTERVFSFSSSGGEGEEVPWPRHPERDVTEPKVPEKIRPLWISDSLRRLGSGQQSLVFGNPHSLRPADAPIFTRQKRIGDMQCLALTDRRLEIPKPGRGNIDETIGGAADGATLLAKQNELDSHPVQ